MIKKELNNNLNAKPKVKRGRKSKVSKEVVKKIKQVEP